MVAKSPIGTETRKMSRQLIGARMPPRISPMNEPLKAGRLVHPHGHAALGLGEGVGEDGGRVGHEHGRPHALEDAHDDQVHGGGVARQPGHAQGEREEGEDGEPEVVHADPAVHVAETAERHHQHAGRDEEAEDHPQQVEAVAREQGIDADAPEDVGQRNEDDGPVDGGHEHAQGRNEQRHPLVVVGQRCGRDRDDAARRVRRSPSPQHGAGQAAATGVGACGGEGARRLMNPSYLPAGARPRLRPSAAQRRRLRGCAGPRRRRSVTSRQPRSTAMIWAQPTAVGSKALMARTRCPRSRKPSDPARRRVGFGQHGQVVAPPETERARPPVRRGTSGRRRSARGGVLAAHAASGPAAAGGSAAGRRRPWPRPGGSASPRAVVTSMGERVWGGRRPGPTSAGWPVVERETRRPGCAGRCRWSAPRRCDPKSSAFDWVSETPEARRRRWRRGGWCRRRRCGRRTAPPRPCRS